MTKYANMLENTVWCNDRSIGNSNTGWIKDGDANSHLLFEGYSRLMKSKPSLECKNEKDRFTVSETKGNGRLTYPVALLTIDELRLAGYGLNNILSGYLSTHQAWWLLSPFTFHYNNYSGVFGENRDRVINHKVNNSYGVRPVISLVSGTIISGGNGTVSNPYQILTD